MCCGVMHANVYLHTIKPRSFSRQKDRGRASVKNQWRKIAAVIGKKLTPLK